MIALLHLSWIRLPTSKSVSPAARRLLDTTFSAHKATIDEHGFAPTNKA